MNSAQGQSKNSNSGPSSKSRKKDDKNLNSSTKYSSAPAKGPDSQRSVTSTATTGAAEESTAAAAAAALLDNKYKNFDEEMEILGEFDAQEIMREMLPPDPILLKQQMEAEERLKKAEKRVQLKERKNIWENCCKEVSEEMIELDAILNLVGLPPHNYTKDKTFPITDYTEAPHIKLCSSKDYLDFYVFPYLLPAIQFLILFAQKHRVLQCRVCTFNAGDFISEYLYNANPRHPSRQMEPVSLFEAPFAVKWLAQYPRPQTPKWLKLTKDEASIIIQRSFRGYLVRRRADIQEVRQFWRDYNADMELERCGLAPPPTTPPPDPSADYDSDYISDEDYELIPPFRTHSQDCELCAKFNEFMTRKNRRHPLYRHHRHHHPETNGPGTGTGTTTGTGTGTSTGTEPPKTGPGRSSLGGQKAKSIHAKLATIRSNVMFNLSDALSFGANNVKSKFTDFEMAGEDAYNAQYGHGHGQGQHHQQPQPVFSDTDLTEDGAAADDEETETADADATDADDGGGKYRYKYSPKFKSQFDKCCFGLSGPYTASTVPTKANPTIDLLCAEFVEQGSNLSGLCAVHSQLHDSVPAPSASAHKDSKDNDNTCTLRDPASCDKFLPVFDEDGNEIPSDVNETETSTAEQDRDRKESDNADGTSDVGDSISTVNVNVIYTEADGADASNSNENEDMGQTIFVKPSNFTINDLNDKNSGIGFKI